MLSSTRSFLLVPVSKLITLTGVIFSITLCTSGSVHSTPVNLTTLELVQIIARHGDRAPIFPYPTDPYRNASWYSINGWGELTEFGAKQIYDLGRYIRQRYDGFLPRKYRKRDFLMLSSDVDRAIMSAESNLAGLYELGPLPRSRDIFKEWQPVPIHTIPKDEDTFIEAKADCPRHLQLFKEYMSSEEHTTFVAQNDDFTDFVANMSGLAEIKQDFEFIFRVQDSLQCQFSHNLTFPAWVNRTVFERLQHFKALSFSWPVKNFEMKRLRVGPLLEKLVGKMRGKVEGANLTRGVGDDEEIPPYQDPLAYRRMYIYSGHDSTISSLLSVLSPPREPRIPPYASALLIELHRDPEKEEYFVELYYKNETGQEPYKLELSSFCENSSSPFSCSFEKFLQSGEKYIPKNWKGECQLQALSSSSSSSTGVGVGLLGAVAPTPEHLTTSGGGGALGERGLMRMIEDGDVEGNHLVMMHPLGIAAPGLSAFAITVIAVASLLASSLLLTSFLNRNRGRAPNISMDPVYQHLS